MESLLEHGADPNGARTAGNGSTSDPLGVETIAVEQSSRYVIGGEDGERHGPRIRLSSGGKARPRESNRNEKLRCDFSVEAELEEVDGTLMGKQPRARAKVAPTSGSGGSNCSCSGAIAGEQEGHAHFSPLHLVCMATVDNEELVSM